MCCQCKHFYYRIDEGLGEKANLSILANVPPRNSLVRWKYTSLWLPSSSWWSLPLDTVLHKEATHRIRPSVVPHLYTGCQCFLGWSKLLCQQLLLSEEGVFSWRRMFAGKSLCSLNTFFFFLTFHEITENLKSFLWKLKKIHSLVNFVHRDLILASLHWKCSSGRI